MQLSKATWMALLFGGLAALLIVAVLWEPPVDSRWPTTQTTAQPTRPNPAPPIVTTDEPRRIAAQSVSTPATSATTPPRATVANTKDSPPPDAPDVDVLANMRGASQALKDALAQKRQDVVDKANEHADHMADAGR